MEQPKFEEFYQESRDACLRAVVATTGDAHLAEDLVAEAFTRAWTSWRKVSVHPAPRAWILRTALNTRISWWRRHRHEVAMADHETAIGTGAEAVDSSAGGIDPHLLAALRQLPRRQREVIALRVFLDLDIESAAKALGIAPRTVSAHLARATATLRGVLTTTGSQEG